MHTYVRRLCVLTLAVVAACTESPDSPDLTGSATSAIASTPFPFACDPVAHEDIAFSGANGLVAWSTPAAVHATRIDSSGNALDSTPIDLGMPPAIAGVTFGVTGLRVAPFTNGGALVVVSTRHDASGMMSDVVSYASIAYRRVDAGGTLGTFPPAAFTRSS